MLYSIYYGNIGTLVRVLKYKYKYAIQVRTQYEYIEYVQYIVLVRTVVWSVLSTE